MRIQLRHAHTQDEWEASTVILAKGEAGVALDTGAIRIGNGVDFWNDLPVEHGPVVSVNGQTGVVVLDKADIGLGNVENTADIDKPVPAAVGVQLDALSNQIQDLLETGGATKESIGLGNVDNTSDANKPISTATQISLNQKAPINNPVFTGTVQGITKSMIGLAQVDNTSDANKPISIATQTALNGKASTTDPRFTDTRTPTAGSVVNASVASGAAISLDKTVDSATRLAMTPTERGAIGFMITTLEELDRGIISGGSDALASLTDPSPDLTVIAVGPNALKLGTSINNTVAVGDNSLSRITIGSSDLVAIGSNTLAKAVQTNNNIALGKNANRFGTSPIGSIAIGKNASLARNNSYDISIGENASSGVVASRGLTNDWETYTTDGGSGGGSIAIGRDALSSAGSLATDNLAIGNEALSSLTLNQNNLAIGNNSLGNLGSKKGPTGLNLTRFSSPKTGTYSWSGTTITAAIPNHELMIGDYVWLQFTGGTFSGALSVSYLDTGGTVRGRVNSIVDGDTFTVTEAKSGTPIASLTDTGNLKMYAFERGTYTNGADRNLAIGSAAGYGITSGSDNIILGTLAGPQLFFGDENYWNRAVVIGRSSATNTENPDDYIVIGSESDTLGGTPTGYTLIGNRINPVAGSDRVVSIGHESAPTGNNSVSIGQQASAGADGVAIGDFSETADVAVVIGSGALNGDGESVTVGASATSNGTNSVVVGNGAYGEAGSTVLGDFASAGYSGIAIGANSIAADGGIALGNAVEAAEDQLKIDAPEVNVQGSLIKVGTDASTDIQIGDADTTVLVGQSNSSGHITLRAQLVTVDDAGATSDARQKTDIRETSLGLDFINRIDPVEFRWARDGEEEGERFHQGVIAQQVKEVIDETGIDFGGYIDQKVNGGEDKLMVRYDEFVAPLIKAVQELSNRVEWLEGRQNGEEW